MNLSEQHRDRTDLPNADLEYHMRRLRPVLDLLKGKDRTLGEWYLKGETEQEAFQQRANDSAAPSGVAIEALSKEYGKKNKDDPKTVGMWNGVRSDQIGALISVEIRVVQREPQIEIVLAGRLSFHHVGDGTQAHAPMRFSAPRLEQRFADAEPVNLPGK